MPPRPFSGRPVTLDPPFILPILASLMFKSGNVEVERGVWLRLKGGPFVDAGRGEGSPMRFFINGQPVLAEAHGESCSWLIRLSPDDLSPLGSINKFTLVPEAFASPAELGISGDARELGFGLESAQFYLPRG